MPGWVTLQLALDIGLVGVILWLSRRSRTVVLKEHTQQVELQPRVAVQAAQWDALVQRAEEVLPLASPYEEAAKLAQQGYTDEEISSRVNLPRGEIDLILHLQRRAQGKRME